MSAKVVIIFAMLACTYALPVVYQHAPIIKTILKHEEAPAHYDFSYSVHDEHTGDIKSQTESRNGHDVKGQYTLIDADGHHRIVDYSADEHNGFQAHVRREPIKGFHPVEHHVKLVAPVHKIAIAPVHKIAVAPIHKVALAPTKLITHDLHHVSHGIAHVSIDAHGLKTIY